MKRYNTYRCPVCKGVTATQNEDGLTTPMFLHCRATPGCTGTAASQMYRVPEDWVKPNVRAEFYKNESGELAVRDLPAQPEKEEK